MGDNERDADGVVAESVAARLRGAGCVFAEDEARLLLEAADDAAARESGPGFDAVLTGLVDRRCAGEPLEQILGWAEFCGLRVVVEPGVFVPRRRTEFLVETAAAMLSAGDLALDLCCGAGAIGLALARAVPGIELHSSDLDPAAVTAARRNVEASKGVGPGEGVGTVHEGDLFESLPPALQGRFRVIAVNAPHVPTGDIPTLPSEARDHENHLALDGGGDGLDLYRRIAAEARVWLTPDGRLVMEAARHQQRAMQDLLNAQGFSTAWARDDERESTVVIAAVL